MENRKVEVRTTRAKGYMMDNENVEVNAKYENGVFHCQEQNSNSEYSIVYAIVELENGNVGRFEIEDIKFKSE